MHTQMQKALYSYMNDMHVQRLEAMHSVNLHLSS